MRITTNKKMLLQSQQETYSDDKKYKNVKMKLVEDMWVS